MDVSLHLGSDFTQVLTLVGDLACVGDFSCVVEPKTVLWGEKGVLSMLQ